MIVARVQLIVVGVPRSDDDSISEQAENVKLFCKRLIRRVDVPLEFVDEYCSSAEAEERLRSAGALTPAAREKGLVDSEAAAIILERWLGIS